MDIKNTSSHQSFGARYIKTTKVKEKLPFLPLYKKIDVDFVELKHKSDIDSVRAYIANNQHTILGPVFWTNFQNIHTNKNLKAFAITRQRTKHKKLDPEKIIGICDGHFTCDWRDGNIFFIDHLETLSKNNKLHNPNCTAPIKGIGKAILKNIIKTMGDGVDSIQLESMPTAKSFYRHLGFKDDCLNPDHFRLPYERFDEFLKMS